MKYNLSEIMHKAWKLYRKGVGSFAEALHRACVHSVWCQGNNPFLSAEIGVLLVHSWYTMDYPCFGCPKIRI